MAPAPSKVQRTGSAYDDSKFWHYLKKVPVFLDAQAFLTQWLQRARSLGPSVDAFASWLGQRADNFVESVVRTLESYCFLDLKRCAVGPSHDRGGALLVIVSLSVIVAVYNAFVHIYMPLANIPFRDPQSILFHAFVFLTLASFLQVVRSDPGGVPMTKAWRTKGCPPAVLGEGANWCERTGSYRPDRSHYCRATRRNIRRMDHHCPWLGTTIGWGNHKHFILLLMYTTGSCGLLGTELHRLTSHWPFYLSHTTYFVEISSLLMASMIGPLFLFHFWLAAKNMTTIEFVEKMKNRSGNLESKYDAGVFANFSAVLGPNPLLWCLPLGTPDGDGFRFPSAAGPERHPDAERGLCATRDSVRARAAMIPTRPSDSAPTQGIRFLPVRYQQGRNGVVSPESDHLSLVSASGSDREVGDIDVVVQASGQVIVSKVADSAAGISSGQNPDDYCSMTETLKIDPVDGKERSLKEVRRKYIYFTEEEILHYWNRKMTSPVRDALQSQCGSFDPESFFVWKSAKEFEEDFAFGCEDVSDRCLSDITRWFHACLPTPRTIATPRRKNVPRTFPQPGRSLPRPASTAKSRDNILHKLIDSPSCSSGSDFVNDG